MRGFKKIFTGLFFMFSFFAVQANPLPGPSLDTEKNLHDMEKKGKKPPKADPLSTPLQTMIIPIIEQSEVAGYLTLEAAIVGRGPAETAQIRDKIFVLHSAIFTDLYGLLDVLWGTGYSPSMESVKKRLNHLCNTLMGEGIIKRLLVHKLSFRKIEKKENPTS